MLSKSMEKYKNYEDIIILLKRYLEGNCDEMTKARLEEWLQASEKNRELLRRIKDREILADKLRFHEQTNINDDWQVIRHKISPSSSHSLFRHWYRYAALIAGIGLIFGILYLRWEKLPEAQSVAQTIRQDSIVPGCRQAYLELASGERIRLGDTLDKIEKIVEGGKLTETGQGLIVTPDRVADVQSRVMNRLKVPKGGEYELMLPDGTKVWLNSDSELKFPLAFPGNERLVSLKGEAYFEVSHDKSKPFQVELEGMKVVVLGTSFNIYAYSDQINATLVKGSVEIQASGEHYKLVPGEQASLREGQVKIEKVDVAEQIGWKEGKFIFRSKRLEEVMTTLSRWYNLEVVYQSPKVKDLHFTGNVPRHATISELLKFLERTHLVHFVIQERTVFVSE